MDGFFTPKQLKKINDAAAAKKPLKRSEAELQKLIDEFCVLDDLKKLIEREHKLVSKKLKGKLRLRGAGVYEGKLGAVNAHYVLRRIFSQEKARRYLNARQFNASFKKSRYLQLDTGKSGKEEPEE